MSPLDPENEEQRHNIQYFGARVNVLKALLTGLNGGYDDVHKDYKVFDIEPIRDEVLEFESVKENFEKSLDWLTDTYVDALNIIHYMTDKYNYEAVQMAFLPTKQRANMGFGICGFANTVDTLSAIKYATVKPIRDENGYVDELCKLQSTILPIRLNEDHLHPNVGIHRLFRNRRCSHFSSRIWFNCSVFDS